jgi:hypothetical protein
MYIHIYEKLHPGINGGGVKRCLGEYKAGPRNNFKAAQHLHEVYHSNRRGYGTIGCGSCWAELDHQSFDMSRLVEPWGCEDTKELHRHEFDKNHNDKRRRTIPTELIIEQIEWERSPRNPANYTN